VVRTICVLFACGERRLFAHSPFIRLDPLPIAMPAIALYTTPPPAARVRFTDAARTAHTTFAVIYDPVPTTCHHDLYFTLASTFLRLSLPCPFCRLLPPRGTRLPRLSR